MMFECKFCPTIVSSATEGVPWLEWAATFAQLVIAAGVLVGFWFSYSQNSKASRQIDLLRRQIEGDEVHKRLSVQPILAASVQTDVASRYIGVKVRNIGLGPAVITDVVMKRGDEQFSMLRGEGYEKAVRIVAPGYRVPEGRDAAVGEENDYLGALGIGSERTLFFCQFDDVPKYQGGLARFNSCTITIVYESIYRLRNTTTV